jgi:pyruvate dehydrogenase E2 component (dihydrolipoamide acetyltransferase)
VTATTSETIVTMPRLSDGMEDGTIVAWLVREGEPVAVGADLVEIETDKATVTYEAPFGGVLRRLVQEGETAAVGAAIADLGTADAGVSTADAGVPAAPAAPAEPERGSRSKASPLARRRAAEAGVNLESVVGSGPRGQIKRRDVEAHLASSAVGSGRGVEISPVARRLARQANLDLAQVTGSGLDGRIRLADVSVLLRREDDAGAPTAVPPAPPSEPDRSENGHVVPCRAARWSWSGGWLRRSRRSLISRSASRSTWRAAENSARR